MTAGMLSVSDVIFSGVQMISVMTVSTRWLCGETKEGLGKAVIEIGAACA